MCLIWRGMDTNATIGHPSLVTAGYEGLSLEAFIDKLSDWCVDVLVDVRKNAISRKKGFSKKALGNACQVNGVAYMHMPALGIPSQLRRGLSSPSDYAHLFYHYKKYILPEQSTALTELLYLCSKGTVALMCFESDHHYCHRSCIADELKLRENLAVAHI